MKKKSPVVQVGLDNLKVVERFSLVWFKFQRIEWGWTREGLG